MNNQLNSITLILMTILFIAVKASAQNIGAQNIEYPVTKKTEQTDDYFGTKVSDPYRWLEDTDSPETKSWVEAQNKITFDYLAKIPYRNKIKQRLTELWNYPSYSQPFKEGKWYFFYKNDGLQNQSVLYIQKDLNSEPEVILDPNKFSEDGTVALAGVDVSTDGKYLAYAVSKSGSDWREIYVMEIESRKLLKDNIKWVKFSGANWYKDGFFYGRYDEPKNENELTGKNQFQKVYYHKLGTEQSEDILIYKDDTNPKRQHSVWSTEEEDYIVLYISEQGRKGNEIYYKKSPFTKDNFIKVYSNYDFDCWPVQNYGSKVYFYTNENAPNGKMLMADLNKPAEPWVTVIPEKEQPLDNISITGDKILAQYMIDVTDKVYVHDLEGKFLYEIQMPGIGNASGFNGKKADKTVFFTMNTMSAPQSIYLYDIENNTVSLFRTSEVKFNSSELESKQVFYTGKDGTRIPMFLVYKKGLKLDGNNPTYLYSYGGFNNSMKPYFSISRIILLENGGVFAMPCIRGGGEYGEQWHEAGMKMNKQNVFDDFIAAAEYLIKEKYTSPGKLAIAGGSNGGLLVGAVTNQRPELFKVSFPAVGVMDMLRFHKFTIGASWVTEYGSSEESEEMFKYLLGYSPLHNIKENINYPAMMVTTADHDDRVVPSHSFKYISTIQEKYKGTNPVLIRIETKAGHGSGKPTAKIIEEYSDMWSFFFYNIGVTPVYE